MVKKTQKQVVIDRINEVGYVDNFWAIQNYILRLGAIIFDLKGEGWNFGDRKFGTGSNRKNFYYTPNGRPPGVACCSDMATFKQHFGECKNAIKVEEKSSKLF